MRSPKEVTAAVIPSNCDNGIDFIEVARWYTAQHRETQPMSATTLMNVSRWIVTALAQIVLGVSGVICLVGLFVAPIAMVIWALVTPEKDWPMHILPENLEVSRVIASGMKGGLLEGCEFAVYQLSPSNVAEIKERSLAFFGNLARPQKSNPKNPYSAWRVTPVSHSFATGALFDCGRGEWSDELSRAFDEPGNFYMITKNREGVIMVIPETGRAAYLYEG